MLDGRLVGFDLNPAYNPIDGIDLHDPMEEPNPAVDESSGHQKPRLNFSLEVGWFRAKTTPPKTTRRMNCSFILLQVESPWAKLGGFEQSYWLKLREF